MDACALYPWFPCPKASGAAPGRVTKHIAAARKILKQDRGAVTLLAGRIEAARKRLDSAFAALQRRHAGPQKQKQPKQRKQRR